MVGNRAVLADKLLGLLTDPLVSSLFASHPNEIGAYFFRIDELKLPPEWNCWWEWATLEPGQWKKVILLNTYYQHRARSPGGGNEEESPSSLPVGLEAIPKELRHLLKQLNDVLLPRDMEDTRPLASARSRLAVERPIGMTPKKAHEVERLTSYIASLLPELSSIEETPIRHFIDIGAGQGYLSRALYSLPVAHGGKEPTVLLHENTLPHILALDSSPEQTAGAQRRLASASKKSTADQHVAHNTGSLAHRTVCIGRQSTGIAGTDSLFQEINDWLLQCAAAERGTSDTHLEEARHQCGSKSIPVIIVALHACGSLTPDILRFTLPNLRARLDLPGQMPRWHVAAAVVVGCCYNLVNPQDFPLSDVFRSSINNRSPDFSLTASHLQLAAQVPSQWFRSEDTMHAASLAVRKVIFRALLEGYLRNCAQTVEEPSESDGKGELPVPSRRLGKLNKRAYANFSTFLREAGAKMGTVVFPLSPPNHDSVRAVEDSNMARRLEVLHVLRSVFGPVVETIIVQDRVQWLQEELSLQSTARDRSLMDVQIVNLFDQAMESGRNLAVVLAPGHVLERRQRLTAL